MKKCYICGQEYPEDEMKILFTGRRKYICKECYQEGHKQAQTRMNENMHRYKKAKD